MSWDWLYWLRQAHIHTPATPDTLNKRQANENMKETMKTEEKYDQVSLSDQHICHQPSTGSSVNSFLRIHTTYNTADQLGV